MFVMIIESLLPFDFFALMIGVLIDQKTFMQMVQEKLQNVHDKFAELGFDPSILAFQWFVCLFSYNMPEEVLFLAFIPLDLSADPGPDHAAGPQGDLQHRTGIGLPDEGLDPDLPRHQYFFPLNPPVGDMFKVLESRNKIFALSPHILYIAMEYKVSQKQVQKLRIQNTLIAIDEVKDYELKRQQKELDKMKTQKQP